MRRKRRRRFRRSEPASRWWRTLQLQHRSSSPRMRGSSTPRLLVSITAVSGILGRRSSRTMTDEFVIQFRDLAAPCVRAFAINSRPLQSEGARNAGRPMRPIAACAMGNGRTHTRCQVTPESPGIPHAVVYGLYVLSPAIRTCLSPSSANCFRRLDANLEASEPHDFAIRFRRPRQERHPRPPHPRPALVTLRNAPHDGTGCEQI